MDQDFPPGMNSLYESDRHHQWQNKLPNVQNHYQEQHSLPGAHTLPPIQAQRSSYEHGAGYDPSRRQQPLPTSVGASYSAYTPQVSQPPFSHGISPYANGQPLFPQPPHSMSMNQAYSGSPSGFPQLRPMPSSATTQGHPMPMPAAYAPNVNYPYGPSTDEQDSQQPRTHVVGSQGRRGILPSDEGRPTAVASNGSSTAKPTVIPQKDADGKYPCPHCQKTYLHGKHLKRHLLRHTGDRPYSCFLCQDTFSRSDILKRHFQKCSIRRGNPTGASHLAHSQNHLKKHGGKKIQTPTTIDTSFNGLTQSSLNNGSPIYSDGAVGMGPVAQQPADNIKHFVDPSGVRDPRNLASASANLNRSTFNFLSGHNGPASLPSSGSTTPLTAKGSGQFPQHLQNDTARQRVNSYSEMNHRNSISHMSSGNHFEGGNFDWTPYPQEKNGTGVKAENVQAQVKTENVQQHEQQDEFLMDNIRGEFMGRGGVNGDTMNGWTMPVISKSKVDQLTRFCQLEGSHDPDDRLLRLSLAPECIQHFLHHYRTFHLHWPFIHMPSFDPNKVWDGLLLSMLCIGAAYSDRLNIQQTRALMRRFNSTIKNSSPCYDKEPPNLDWRDNETVNLMAEQLHACVMMVTTALWHGDDFQREEAMRDFGRCMRLARLLHLHEPAPPDNPCHSILHQPGSVEHVFVDQFPWESWLWQEKRIRFMWGWYLTDAVQVIFFNRPPNIDLHELNLPLPADDAAWDAETSEACAAALGLRGPSAQAFNISGSRRKKQPEMDLALQVLEDPGKDFTSRATNAWGKFLLIHGALVRLWTAQKYSSVEAGRKDAASIDCDWVLDVKSDRKNSLISNDYLSPSGTHFSDPLKTIDLALDKWKKAWDQDMIVQYPPGITRAGYCRDGIHYYWLAKLLMQNSDHVNVHTPWSQRFNQILAILKTVKNFVSSKQVSSGQSIGSLGTIDESYGLGDLTKDMKLLFTPFKDSKPPTPPHLASDTWTKAWDHKQAL